MADGDVWRGFLSPLMSKRTTSMLITTKSAKFWLITRVLCEGSDEACLSVLLKTANRTPVSSELTLGSIGPGHVVDIIVIALNLWLQPLAGKIKLLAWREASLDRTHGTKHPLFCFMRTEHWFTIVWALSSCRFSCRPAADMQKTLLP